jgi:hypothetical protein
MNTDTDVNTKKWTDLEEYVMKSNDADFPSILTSDRGNTKSYPERYNDFKTRLGNEQDNVEYENTLSSLDSVLNLLLDKSIRDTKEIYEKIVVLNKHGKGHIELVIKHASEFIKYIKSTNSDMMLTPFEAFILLWPYRFMILVTNMDVKNIQPLSTTFL